MMRSWCFSGCPKVTQETRWAAAGSARHPGQVRQRLRAAALPEQQGQLWLSPQPHGTGRLSQVGPALPGGGARGEGRRGGGEAPHPPPGRQAQRSDSAVFGHKGTDQTQPCTVATLPPTPLPTGTHRQCCLICFIQNETKRNKNHARSHIGWPGTAPELGACHVQQRGLRLLLLQFPCQSEDTGKGQWGSLAAWGAVWPGQRPGPLCSQPRAKLTQGPDARASAGLGTAGAKETCFHGGSGGLAGAGQRSLRDLPHCRRRP